MFVLVLCSGVMYFGDLFVVFVVFPFLGGGGDFELVFCCLLCFVVLCVLRFYLFVLCCCVVASTFAQRSTQ